MGSDQAPSHSGLVAAAGSTGRSGATLLRNMPDARPKELSKRFSIGRGCARENDVLLLDRTSLEVPERPAAPLAKEVGPRSFGELDCEAGRSQGRKDLPVCVEGGAAEEVLALHANAPWLRRVGLTELGGQSVEVGLCHTTPCWATCSPRVKM